MTVLARFGFDTIAAAAAVALVLWALKSVDTEPKTDAPARYGIVKVDIQTLVAYHSRRAIPG
jgi:hypothetical protein